jgi:transcriptional regulator with XRE-family HTH domain
MAIPNQARPCDQIRSLLRGLRSRLDPSISALGEHERLGSRRGKIVSQEELAEAVGVSRGWYAMLERGEPIQPSITMLHRVAVALNATRDERLKLFKLAIPELQSLF